MLQFNKLSLSGFKSFVESTELLIELGLTGIVGPNGCGKSNLVEALRWVMGETSAKQMRSGEMDDVIFGGTLTRPARNVAEVVLSLNNSERLAPAQFNDTNELEVSRRIEREKGSYYRVNGREARAREVQLLFTDSATGARSTSLVSQGHVGAVINAKPTDRRRLLEEAASITGLHSRRHEAELRLRGAEINLERLETIFVTLDAQLAGLKKQTRQATRYKNLSAHIRRAEATLFYLRWIAAEDELESNRKRLTEEEKTVAELTAVASTAAACQAKHAEELPALHQTESEAAAKLHRLTVASENLDVEARRVSDATADANERQDQITADRERETALASDAEAAIKRLEGERAEIESAGENDEAQRDQAAADLSAAAETIATLDYELTELTHCIATNEARQSALANRIEELEARQQRLTARAGEISTERAKLEAAGEDEASTQATATAVDETRTALEAARTNHKSAEQTRTKSEEHERQATAALHRTTADVARLESEEKTLAAIFDDDDDLWPPLIDAVTVESGYEMALGAALGDDLAVPADEAAPAHWRTLDPIAITPPLPAGAQPLSEVVRGPAALTRRLTQVGLVAREADGRRMATDLSQGQRLVSRDGSLWRWDGFTVSACAATAAAARLEQRNRLVEVRGQLETACAAERDAEATRNRYLNAEDEARAHERAAREMVAAADDAYNRDRDAEAQAKDASAAELSRLAALADTAQMLRTDMEENRTVLSEVRRELDATTDTDGKRDQATTLKAALDQRRTEHVECRSRNDSLERQAEQRSRRLEAIKVEIESWRLRNASAAEQVSQLNKRQLALSVEIKQLAERPRKIQHQRGALLDALGDAEDRRSIAADGLAEAKTALREADNALRESEARLATSREQTVRLEGAVEQAKQACHAIVERVKERLECRPDQLSEVSGVKLDAELPEIEAIERKVQRLQRERETMGPVNLRAETEASEIGEQIETMNDERDDLLLSIDKLRQGINRLNRESRARLLASFKEVDEHFQDLFVRLFGGGRAHLALTETEDPLEAGLEIMASPPGKKLQMLSLLSGGEQALTALALLFSVFLTNPAPICILDEVDAALDDANVDRFCSMLEKMAHHQSTRFVIITHHRMTMARMDRLFGVTMSERGVSQLVSVDLERAEELRQTA